MKVNKLIEENTYILMDIISFFEPFYASTIFSSPNVKYSGYSF